MEIREATTSDVSAIRSLARQTWRENYTVPESIVDGAVSAWYDDDEMARYVDDSDQVCLVSVDGDVVGFVHGATDKDGTGSVLRIVAHPDHDDETIMESLLAEVEKELIDAGADSIRAMALADNERVTGFYEAHGFHKVAEAETKLGDHTHTERVYARA